MYKLRMSSYCGMGETIVDDCERDEARREAAFRLRRLRRQGFPIATLNPGTEWEVCEPEGCAMVPDACGILHIEHDTYECHECGCQHETEEEARECCAETWWDHIDD